MIQGLWETTKLQPSHKRKKHSAHKNNNHQLHTLDKCRRKHADHFLPHSSFRNGLLWPVFKTRNPLSLWTKKRERKETEGVKRCGAIPGVPKNSTTKLEIPQAPHETQAGAAWATGVTTAAVTYRHSSSPLPQGLPRCARDGIKKLWERVVGEGLVHTLFTSVRAARSAKTKLQSEVLFQTYTELSKNIGTHTDRRQKHTSKKETKHTCPHTHM